MISLRTVKFPRRIATDIHGLFIWGFWGLISKFFVHNILIGLVHDLHSGGLAIQYYHIVITCKFTYCGEILVVLRWKK